MKERTVNIIKRDLKFSLFIMMLNFIFYYLFLFFISDITAILLVAIIWFDGFFILALVAEVASLILYDHEFR